MAEVKLDELSSKIYELQRKIEQMDKQIYEDIRKEIKDRSENYAKEINDQLARQMADSNEFKEALSKVFAWGIREQMEKSMGNASHTIVTGHAKKLTEELNALKKQVDEKQKEVNQALNDK